jgi:hypothetical protein
MDESANDAENMSSRRISPVARRAAILAFTLSAFAATTALAASEKWEGYWAKNRKECRAGDGPDSKTMIDLKNVEKGKPAPLYDQYENHCRVDSHATEGNVTRLKLTCFEFWDDYKAKKNPRPATVTITPLDQGRIRIDGAVYVKCRK